TPVSTRRASRMRVKISGPRLRPFLGPVTPARFAVFFVRDDSIACSLSRSRSSSSSALMRFLFGKGTGEARPPVHVGSRNHFFRSGGRVAVSPVSDSNPTPRSERGLQERGSRSDAAWWSPVRAPEGSGAAADVAGEAFEPSDDREDQTARHGNVPFV